MSDASQARDPPNTGGAAWLTGQAVALRELSWHLATSPAPNAQSVVQWHALAWLLAKVTAAESDLTPIAGPLDEAPQNFALVQQQADALARRAAGQTFDSARAARFTRIIAGLDNEFLHATELPRELLFFRAQRIVAALERLAAAEANAASGLTNAGQLQELRQDRRWEGEFDAEQFGQGLARYRSSLSPALP